MNKDILAKLKSLTHEEKEILAGRQEINKNLYTNSSSSLIIDSNKLLSKGKIIEIRTHTRFIHFPKHTHNYVEVVYMCQGSTTHIVNGNKVTLEEGDLLFLNQNATQEILPAGEEDIAVNFIILPGFFDYSLKLLNKDENIIRGFIVGCLRDESSEIDYLHFRISEVLPVQNLIENLIWTLLNDQPNKRSTNQITMGLLFLQLANLSEKITIGSKAPGKDIVLEVIRYIEENYRDGTLSEIALRLHYDLYRVSRVIKDATGNTFTELLQAKRLRQGAYLLANTPLPVYSIANNVGYENLSYFHRIFKERYKMTPKEFRVQNRPK